jgi:hypothetical protein
MLPSMLKIVEQLRQWDVHITTCTQCERWSNGDPRKHNDGSDQPCEEGLILIRTLVQIMQ